MDLKDKVAIVTGAASGIGKATATAFARLGAQMVVVDLNADGAKSVAAEINGLGIGCDVSSDCHGARR